MRNFSMALIILLISSPCLGQTGWKSWVVADGGPLWGAHEITGDIRLQGGLQSNGWLIGAGAAYDTYRYRTLPVFVQGRKMFTERKTKPFVMVSVGASLEMEEDQELPVEATPIWGRWMDPAYQYSNGIYAEGGLGIAFLTNKRIGINVSLSYSYKTIEESYSDYTWTGITTERIAVQNKYLMNRLSFRLGFQF
ncbi:MAG TPA: hypothetical protein VLA46_10040 [Saprospiraceae bacterium]|nr:hypothetical protein [Saprospiraceae bacterium]